MQNNLNALKSGLFCTLSCDVDTYFNDVKDNILVEAVQDTLGYTVVVPGSMDKQKILQVFELCERKAEV